jgi:pilus assembly protein CpaB
VTVIGVGSTTPGQTTTTASDGTATTEVLPNALLTLALSKEDAERVLFASTNGALAFGLLTKDSDTPKGQGVTDRNLFP